MKDALSRGAVPVKESNFPIAWLGIFGDVEDRAVDVQRLQDVFDDSLEIELRSCAHLHPKDQFVPALTLSRPNDPPHVLGRAAHRAFAQFDRIGT